VSDTPLSRELLEELLEREPRVLIELVLQQGAALAEQRELIVAQQRTIEGLQKRVEQLEQALAESGGGPPGGAAPFRIAEHKRKVQPKPPGRKKGHRGEYLHAPEQIDECIEVALEHCPQCGTRIEESESLEQTILELPPVRPHVVRLVTHRAKCPCCQKEIASSHPLQVSQASGAAGTHLGPRALAVSGTLRHGLGLSVRRTCDVLDQLFGLKLSPGGLCRALDRVARRLEVSFCQLQEQITGASVVHTDETGWWLENQRAMLWVFCHSKATLYRVVAHRDRATFHETIPPDYPGVLVSDCLSVYDQATDLQHKCYSHHLKAISNAQQARGSPSPWLESVASLLKNAIVLGKERHRGPTEALWTRRKEALKLGGRVVLSEEPRPCPHEESVRARLFKQRDHLFVFLEHEGVDATNNLAERQLRPAVIRRKISCGNKTRRGARTFEVLASHAATCLQRGEDFLELLTAAARLQPA
jgi:transposase